MSKLVLLTTAAASLLFAATTVQAQQGQFPLLRGENFARPADCPTGSFYLSAEDMITSCAGFEESGEEKQAEDSAAAASTAPEEVTPSADGGAQSIGEVNREGAGGAAGGDDVDIDPDTGPGPEGNN